MATETLSFDILARDLASPSFRNMGRAAASASGDLRGLSDRLDRIAGKTAMARVGLDGDREASVQLDRLGAKIIQLSGRKVDPEVDLQGYLRTRAQIDSIDLALDKLNAKRTRIHISVDKVAGLGFFQPSALGTALALTPALIPLAASATAAVTALGVSFGAAGAGALGFGLVAKTVLTSVGENAKKLQELNMRLNAATTAAQKKAIREQITALTSGWSAGYRQLIGQFQDFQVKWQHVSQVIAVPALNAWLTTLTNGLKFLRPLIGPVADVFRVWGITLNTYFTTPSTVRQIRDMAAAFGNFSAQQLYRIGRFIADIGRGIFNLGKDFAANGANFSAAGTWLSGIGAGFLTWSKSAAARNDVHSFMKFISDNSGSISSILKDLATLLPGIFQGATATGAAELKALAFLLNQIAALPPGWQKPVTEFAGAMLLLSKVGVVKVGLSIAGLGGAATGTGIAGGLLAGAPQGFAVAAAGMVAGFVLKVRSDLKKAIPELGHDFANLASGLGGFAATSAEGIAGAFTDRFHKQIVAGTDAAWAAVVASFHTFVHDMASSFDAFRHAMSASFAVLRHDVAAIWGAIWRTLVASFNAFMRTMAGSFNAFRRSIAASFATDRHDIAAIWDLIWRNTVARTQSGISAVVHWFSTLPGRTVGALRGAGHALAAFWSAAMNEMFNAIRNVGGRIIGWFGGFVKSVLGFIGKLIGRGSPATEFAAIGRDMMLGLEKGIKDHAHRVANAAKSAAQGAVSSSALGGDAAANERLARRIFPWGAAQWPAFRAVVMAESGFNRFARNPSGAYGIPQALPPTKLPFAGQAAGGSHAGPQLSWMFNYIRQVYGTPANAWAHEQRFHWYGSGGLIGEPVVGIGLRSGRGYGFGENGPEMVVPGRGGGSTTIVVHVDPAIAAVTPDRKLGRHIAGHLNAAFKGGVKLYGPGTGTHFP